MSTAWSNLPNAKYIDMLLANVTATPRKWNNNLSIAWSDEHRDACNAANIAGRQPAMQAAVLSLPSEDVLAVWSAMLALIAYDDCAYLLGEKPEHVQLLALLGNNPAATLIYPACVILQREIARISSKVTNRAL